MPILPPPSGAAGGDTRAESDTSFTTDAGSIAPPLSDGRIVYAVQPGDTMIGIASRFKLTLADLYAVSGVTPDRSSASAREIVIGYADQNDTQLSGERTSSTAQRFNSAELAADGSYVHRVESGDTLISIAIQYDLTLSELYEVSAWTRILCSVSGEAVAVGYQPVPSRRCRRQRIGRTLIPPQFANAKIREDGKFIHIVVAGDTPGSIALQYGLTLDHPTQ